MSAYRLIYELADGVIFRSLHVGHSLSRATLNLNVKGPWCELPLSQLGSDPLGPPIEVWKGGLSILFPQAKLDRTTACLVIPLTSLMLPFWNNPSSNEAVERICMMLGKSRQTQSLVRKATARFPGGPRIHRCVEACLSDRDKTWEARRKRSYEQGRQPKFGQPTLRSALLDAVVLAYWNQIGKSKRREIFTETLINALAEISPTEAEFIGYMDGSNNHRDAPLFKYIKSRHISGFRRGRLTIEERRMRNSPPMAKLVE